MILALECAGQNEADNSVIDESNISSRQLLVPAPPVPSAVLPGNYYGNKSILKCNLYHYCYNINYLIYLKIN